MTDPDAGSGARDARDSHDNDKNIGRSIKRELFGSAGCPHTQEMRDSLEWRGVEFVEYDVEADASAHAHMCALSGGQRMVPMLVEDGKVVQIGWQGRGCIVNGE